MRQQEIRSLLLPAVICCGMLSIAAGAVRAENVPADGIIRNLAYRNDVANLDDYAKSQCRIDLYIPPGKKDFATIVWLHGGGLTGGKRSIPKELMNQGIAIVGVGYRLSPHVKVETCLDDATAATAWTLQHIADYGGSPSKVVVSGHSAGAYLETLVVLDQSLLPQHGANAKQIAGLAPLSGQAITHFTARAEQGVPKTQPVIDQLAPLFHVRKDAPPILIVSGDRELEMLGRYEENAYFWRMLKVVGHADVTLIELPGADHGGMAVPAYPHLVQFVNRVTQVPVGVIPGK